MRVSFAACALSALVAVGTVAGGAQAPPAAQSSSATQPAFRAGTTLVEVDAIVRDRDGRFAEGLTLDDFEVLEEGQPQRVELFFLVSGPGTVAAAPRVTPPGPSGASSLPVAAPQRVFVLVLDQEHIEPGAFKRLQSAAERFLTDQFREGDVGGVVTGGRVAGNRLTTNRQELVDAVRAAKAQGTAQNSRKLDRLEWPRVSDVEAIRIALSNDQEVIAAAVRRALADDPGASRLPLDSVVMQKARAMVDQMRPAAARTVTTLKALITGLGRVPGRKTVVLLTDGFFVEESWADLRQIAGQAARSNVRIYSLDTRGLNRRGDPTDLRTLSPMNPTGSAPLDAYDTVEDGPNTLAADTGGYAIRNTNDFAGALAEVADDTSRYYVLGYSPSEPSPAGTYRRIEVRVKRPGASVRARRGYLSAGPVAAAAGTEPAAPPTAPPPGSEPSPARDVPASNAAPPSGATPPPAAPGAPPVSPTPGSTAPTASGAAPRAGAATAAAAPAFAMRPDAKTRVTALAGKPPAEGSPQDIAAQGWDEYSRGNLEAAQRLLGQAVSAAGAAPWVSYALGFAEIGLGRPRDAATAWERVRSAAPEFEAVYLDLADAYLQLDESGHAVEVLRAAEQRWPGDPDVLNALGTVQVRRGALNDAIATFERALASAPDEALTHFNLGRTYELRYYQLRRFSTPTARWVDNPADARKAIEHYEAYLKRGGPYEADAQAAIDRLRWK
jgi:VWFA-related protein